MLRALFRPKSIIRRSHSVDPDDTRRTKTTLRRLGYFETPSYGITPYPDEPMFRGIEDFQDDFDLKRDGVMNPDGETVAKLNEVLNFKDRVSQASAQKTRSTNREDDADGQQTAMAPAIPIIVYEISAVFGMTVAAAYTWWLSLSTEEKNRVREQIKSEQEGGSIKDPDDGECERLLKIDMDTCRQISKNRGKQAGVRCYKSANERYSACRRGKPEDQWPPLDTWNN